MCHLQQGKHQSGLSVLTVMIAKIPNLWKEESLNLIRNASHGKKRKQLSERLLLKHRVPNVAHFVDFETEIISRLPRFVHRLFLVSILVENVPLSRIYFSPDEDAPHRRSTRSRNSSRLSRQRSERSNVGEVMMTSRPK